MPRRPAPHVPATSMRHTDPRPLFKKDVRTRLPSIRALIMMETSSSADSYGLLTRNTAVGEEEEVRCEARPTGRSRAHDAVTRGKVATHRMNTGSLAMSAVLGMFTALGPSALREKRL
jgi:hypothetical protein